MAVKEFLKPTSKIEEIGRFSMHELGGSHLSKLLEYFNNIFTYVQQYFKNSLIDFGLALTKFEAWLIRLYISTIG